MRVNEPLAFLFDSGFSVGTQGAVLGRLLFQVIG